MSRIQFIVACAILLALAVVLPKKGGGQTVNGSFRGTVTDSTGATVPGAKVKLTSTATGVARETVTDSTGSYVLPEIAPGVYDFTVSAQGFQTIETRGVTLLVNQSAVIDFSLKLGTVTSKVTVVAQAPLANVTNATIATVVGAEEVQQLPLNGRQFTQLILLSPGTSPQGSGQQAFFEIHSDYGAISPAVHGARPEMNSFSIDGVENEELFFNFPALNPPPDAIQEFNVQTNMSSGQFGRAAGANVNVVTRSGGNEFHGDAWEFLRNTSLDARNFFNPTVSTFHQNQFGGTLGGPIRKNKVWFFGWYEGFRKTLGSTILDLVPTPAQLNGDLSGLPPIFNPFTTTQTGTDAQGNPIFTRAQFTNNQIPTSLLNPAALAIAQYVYPASNYSGSGVNFLDSTPVQTSTNQFGTRVDAALSQKTTLFGRFAWDNAARTLPSGIPIEPTFQKQLDYQQVVGVTHTFSPTLVLDVHGQYLRNYILLLGNFPPASLFQSTGLYKDWPAPQDLKEVMPSFSIAGIEGVPGVAQSLPSTPQHDWEINGSLTKILSGHTLTAGASVIHTWFLDNCTYASGSFDNLPTNDPSNPSTTGAGLASFLLGLPSAATDLRGTAEVRLHGNYYGLYLDDVWKATPKLTVTLGLRYDYASPLEEDLGRQASLDFMHSTPTHTIWLLDQNAKPPIDLSSSNATIQRIPNGYWMPDRDNWAPRLALAYRLPHDLAVRSGFGIFYDFNQSTLQDANDIMGQWPFGFPDFTPPNLNQPSVANPLPQHVLGVNVFPPFVASANPPGSPGFAGNRFNERPMVQEWDLAVDKTLAKGMLLSVTYFGSKGTHTVIVPFLNVAPTPGPGNPQARAALPQFSGFEVTADWGNSSYNGAEVKFEKRFSAGLSFLASYTYSKSIDYQSAAHGSAQPGENIQNGLNFRADRAVSDYDIPQNFVFNYVYELPFGKGKRFLNRVGSVANHLVSGWQMTGILSLHSGFPFNLYVPFDNANTGGGTFTSTERPSLVGSLFPSGFQQNIQHWFNTSALAAIPYTYGNLGRNAVRQPDFRNFDFGIFKRTKITEATSLEFRSEFFNLPNHANFGPPDGNFSDSTFGQVLSAGNPRFVQFGLKLLF